MKKSLQTIQYQIHLQAQRRESHFEQLHEYFQKTTLIEAAAKHIGISRKKAISVTKQVLKQQYRPQEVRYVDIPKDHGKTRTISIIHEADKFLQFALKCLMEPIFEADFLPCSFGFRPMLSPKHAIAKVLELVKQGHTALLQLDIAQYFDGINHEQLMTTIQQRIRDPIVLQLISLWVKQCGNLGVPQGSPLSPLLANIYLHPFDQVVTQAGGKKGFHYLRFADDLLFLAPSSSKLPLKLAKSELKQINLKLQSAKTAKFDLRKQALNYLGFELNLIKQSRYWGIKRQWFPQLLPNTKAFNKWEASLAKQAKAGKHKNWEPLKKALHRWLQPYKCDQLDWQVLNQIIVHQISEYYKLSPDLVAQQIPLQSWK
ncbi:MAG: reverse transcriptase domain-containing protein [Flammeovirgaceae bacterium]